MTQPGNNSQPAKSSAKEYLVLVLIILVGLPIAWKWGARDGRDLAAKAYGENAKATAAAQAPAAAPATEGDDANKAPESTPESIERGAALFKANCVACHGEKGDGKGPAAVAFTPPPRNFTDPNAKWTRGNAPDQIFTTVSKGVEGTGMAGFEGALTAEQRWDLVHFVASLAGKGTP
jgi:mono/diheme cytochrome c family protein